MTDLIAGQPGDEGASSAPALTQADIDRIKAELSSAFDERAKGFQRLLAGRDETIKALEGKLDDFESAALPDDERLAKREQKLREENERLRSELELRELSGEYGDEFPIFQEILKAPTAKDQLEAIRRLRTPQAPAAAPRPTASGIDLNNPRPEVPDGVVLPDGTSMTDDLAARILGSVRHVRDTRR